MAGGFKQFGPTYKTTDIVRLGYEGILNGQHDISAELVSKAMKNMPGTGVADSSTLENVEPNVALAGKIAGAKADGIGLAGIGGEGAIGLFREDLHDMVNASEKATFYFRGGEYYISTSRVGKIADTAGNPLKTPVFKMGDKLTTDGNGGLVPVTAKAIDDGNGTSVAMPDNPTIVGIVTFDGAYPAGNMFEWAGSVANGGEYIGVILYI